MVRVALLLLLVAGLPITSGCGVFDDSLVDGSGDGSNERPDGEYCEVVAEWDSAWRQLEAEVLRLTNVERSQGANCGVLGYFPPVPALTFEERLRCSARNHSWDMAAEDYFDHTNLLGESSADRIERAGYAWKAAGENIAAGQPTPAEVVESWMGSDGHCQNVMGAVFSELGVGYYFDPTALYGHYWTQNFGHPR
jgi:uncharacterized protein YkwD